MSFKRIGLRIAALALAMMILATSPAAFSSIKASAATLSQMQAESERLQKEAKALETQINSQERNLTDQKAYKKTLDSKIANTRAQIDLLGDRIDAMNAQITSLNSTIEQKETAIADKETAIAKRFQSLRQRLRAISKSGNLSSLQMLMDTGSYTDYLIKSKMMERVAENDQALMDELEKEIEVIDAEKAKLASDKSSVAQHLNEVQSLKNQANAQKSELEVLYAKANAALKKIQSNLSNYNQQLEITKEQQKAIDRQISSIIDKNTSKGKYGGSMFWPVPAVHNISSYFGWRPSLGDNHTGVDIANGSVPVYGQDIVAAADGVVIYANKTDSWGYSYGYYLIVDHGLDSSGRKISTLYAHCSKILASVGQHVKGGQTVLAKVGATGNVYGAHLHFEVRVNGNTVDPIKNGYIRK